MLFRSTVTFAGNSKTKFKGGETFIDLGKGGKDVVEFTKFKNIKNGTVIIENFDKKDTLIVNKKSFDYDKLQDTDQLVSSIKEIGIGIEARLL